MARLRGGRTLPHLDQPRPRIEDALHRTVTFTYTTTLEVLREVFPEKRLMLKSQPFGKPTQTQLFGDRSPKEGEMDIILYNKAG
jgi:hypothetical protein